MHPIEVIHMDVLGGLSVTRSIPRRLTMKLTVSINDFLYFYTGTGDVIGVFIHLLAEKPLFMRATKAESSHLDYEMHIDGVKRSG